MLKQKSVTISVKPNTYKRLFDLKGELSFDKSNDETRKRVDFDYVITYLLDKV